MRTTRITARVRRRAPPLLAAVRITPVPCIRRSCATGREAARSAAWRSCPSAPPAIRQLLELAPANAWRLRLGGTEESVPLGEIQVGDWLRVKPGEKIPAATAPTSWR
jgi:hypothetical protein